MNYEGFVKGKKTLLIAPAGFGKTHTIVECLKYTPDKQLILTHTHAGVHSLKNKVQKSKVPSNIYRIETISSFAQKYVNAFYIGTDLPPQEENKKYHPFVIKKAIAIFNSPFPQKVLFNSYAGLFVDEYQDCTKLQHEMIMSLSKVLPTHLLGDPLQAIFNFNGGLVDFEEDLKEFEKFPPLSTPYRWMNAKRDDLGKALQEIRGKLENKEPVDLSLYSPTIEIIEEECMLRPPHNKRLMELQNKKERGILILTPDSHNKATRVNFTKAYPTFLPLISIDEKDFYILSKEVDKLVGNITEQGIRDIIYCCKDLFSKTSLDKYFNKTGLINKKNKDESVLLLKEQIQNSNCLQGIKIILEMILKLEGVKCYPREIFNSLLISIEDAFHKKVSVYTSMKQHRNTIRCAGRKIAQKCVGTTLLTKGLEFDTVVVLNAHKFECPKHLYVALTRAANKLIIFTTSKIILAK